MTPEQKQSELERHKEILFAGTDYLLSRQAGSLVFDGEDHIAEAYQQRKRQIEKYYQQRRLDRLQKHLANMVNAAQSRIDFNFAPYIKEKTGFDIDIFEDLRKRVGAIIGQNEIQGEEESNDIATMLRFYHETSASEEEVNRLTVLLTNYHNQNKASRKIKSGYSEVISRVEKDGIEEVKIMISSGPKPKHYVEQEAISPDGKRKLRMTQWDDGNYASTSVTIQFTAGSGAIYATSGIHPEVTARWKDNATVVIETKKECTPNAQYRQVRSFEDVISIEYIEHS